MPESWEVKQNRIQGATARAAEMVDSVVIWGWGGKGGRNSSRIRWVRSQNVSNKSIYREQSLLIGVSEVGKWMESRVLGMSRKYVVSLIMINKWRRWKWMKSWKWGWASSCCSLASTQFHRRLLREIVRVIQRRHNLGHYDNTLILSV